eukprot:TRINITY_DN65376_c0_g1_i1.p1 TRINITY_DN65376_c0_g1~~TRINITY_DN65376_c0_g1_i1.p1  ORF type:complete len:254 (+),score=44.87 TRINITY_DN65376_c0_g1_i1:113-874(+)
MSPQESPARSPQESPARVARQISAILDSLSTANQVHARTHEPGDPRAFLECITVPARTMAAYMAQFDPLKRNEAWPVALVLIDRYCRKAGVPFNAHVMHRLVVVSFVVACKLCYDLAALSAPTALRGSVRLDDLNEMERFFLILIDFDCSVNQSHYTAVVNNIDFLEARAREAADSPSDKIVSVLPDSFIAPTLPQVPRPPSSPATPGSGGAGRNVRGAQSPTFLPSVQNCRPRARIEEAKKLAKEEIGRSRK